MSRAVDAKEFVMEHTEKIVGIIGGMGPEATVDLMTRIIKNTPALDDVDHVRCIVDNNPKIPSRIKALVEGNGENPGPVMADMAKRLEAWGADFLCIPCNTAHNYYDYVKDAVSIPVLHLIRLAVEATLKVLPPSGRVGILASPAVRQTRLYTDIFNQCGVISVYLNATNETALLDLIKRIKAGHTGDNEKQILAELAQTLVSQDIDVIILACTELGIIANNIPFAVPVIDASEVLAKKIVEKAKG